MVNGIYGRECEVGDASRLLLGAEKVLIVGDEIFKKSEVSQIKTIIKSTDIYFVSVSQTSLRIWRYYNPGLYALTPSGPILVKGLYLC